MNDHNPQSLAELGLLQCFSCDYDLRGHMSESIICPECGHKNTLESLLQAAQLTGVDFEHTETRPARCAAIFVIIVLGASLLLGGLRELGTMLLICGGCCWCITAYRFGRSFCFSGGWTIVLWYYHLSVIVCICPAIIMLMIYELLFSQRGMMASVGSSSLGVAVFLACAIAVLICFLIKLKRSPLNPVAIGRRKLWKLCRSRLKAKCDLGFMKQK